MKQNIVIPSMKHRPICLIIFKPDNITPTTRTDLNALILSSLSGTEISKKTFDRLSHFTKDERLLYIPTKENTRKFLKFKVENEALREKPELAIDPAVGLFDVLPFKGHLCIRILTNRILQRLDMELAKTIGNKLSNQGKVYIMFHDRKPTTDRSSDYEHFIEIAHNNIVSEMKTSSNMDVRVFDKVFEKYSISIRDIVEELDMGVEILCAPYDIKEYITRINELEASNNTNEISNIKLSDEDGDNIGSEADREKTILTTLIERTNELIQYRKIPIETIHFKMDPTFFSHLMTLR